MSNPTISVPEFRRSNEPYEVRSGAISSEAGSPNSLTADNDVDDGTKGSWAKRTPKACDRCRHKKTKCTGESPCQRCRLDNTVCSYTNRRPKEGPNFNPQAAQKDAAMSMLYKCIEVMNRQLLTAKLGPYSDPAVYSEAETEDFIIGVVLDRFGISPMLDEYDNQPVYLPGQRGFVVEANSIEFPSYTPMLGAMSNASSYRSGTQYSQPLNAIQQVHSIPAHHDHYTMSREHYQPQPIERRDIPAITTPDLDRNIEYASSPDTTTPMTPGPPVVMDIDNIFDLTSITSSGTSQQGHYAEADPQIQNVWYGPDKQHQHQQHSSTQAWTQSRQSSQGGIISAENLQIHNSNAMDNSSRSVKKGRSPRQPYDGRSIQKRPTSSPFGSAHKSQQHQHQAQMDRFRKHGGSPRPESAAYPGVYVNSSHGPNSSIPLPAHIAELTVAEQAASSQWSSPWDQYSGPISSHSYPSSICSSQNGCSSPETILSVGYASIPRSTSHDTNPVADVPIGSATVSLESMLGDPRSRELSNQSGPEMMWTPNW